MNYLCMAVQKEVVRRENFGSREQAWEYFWENFGDCVAEKLEVEKKKLEGRIRYYDRREKRYQEDPGIRSECLQRREAARKEMEFIDLQLHGEEVKYQVCRYEERYDLYDQPVFGESAPILHLAGICYTGSRFRVTEEKYYCAGWKSVGEERILEVRKRMPGAVTANSISLDICPESPKAAGQFQKIIRKAVTEARRNFHTIECS